MDRLHAMKVFVCVADQQSFAGAARTLSMSRPAVSRAIASLEEAVGAQLLVRTTRSVGLTQAGQRYLADCASILEAVAEADAALAGYTKTPTGELSLTAPAMFGRLHVLPLIGEFMEQHPDVTVQALLLDRVVSLTQEGIDLGVRIGHLDDSARVATKVGEVVPLTVAAPAYLDRRGVPTHPGDLADHRLVAHVNDAAPRSWLFRGDRVSIRPSFTVNDTLGGIDMARRGYGVARPLSYQVGAELAAGTLVRVLEDWEPAPLPVHLVRRGVRVPARVRAFLDLAAPRLRALSDAGWPAQDPR